MKKPILKFSLLTFSALLAACGSGSGDGLSEAEGTITKDEAATAADSIASAFPTSIAGSAALGAAGGLMGIDTLRTNDDEKDSCTKKEPAELVDADDDGIPVSLKVTYDCKDVGTIKLNQSGSYSLSDKNDADKIGGFTGEMSFTSSYTQDGGFTSESTYSGKFDQTRDGATVSGSTSYKLENKGQVAGQEFSGVAAGMNITYKLTGTDANDIEKAGTAEISGFYALSPATVDGKPQSRVVKISSEALTYDESCDSGYKSGTITATDGKDNKIVYTFTDCTVARTYNGEAI